MIILNFDIFSTVIRQISVIGDPHFIVPLWSGKMLCYSIQGYPGLEFNLIHSSSLVINAQFVNTIGDVDDSEATWIGKLAVILQYGPKTQTVIFDSINRDVIIFGYGKMKADVIKNLTFYKNGTVKCVQTVRNEVANPTISLHYIKEQASFDIEFHKNHLDVSWNLQYNKLHELEGLIGKDLLTNRKNVNSKTIA